MALGLTIVAVGFGILTMLTPDTPYLVIAAAFTILGAGMSTAAPATSEIMTSVPLSKAGVGSAVNDTTRELGGALGIALLGSIANTAYRSGVDLDRVQLPAGPRPRSPSAPPARSLSGFGWRRRGRGPGGLRLHQRLHAHEHGGGRHRPRRCGRDPRRVAAGWRRTVEADVVDDDAIETHDLELLPVGAGEMRE